MKRIYFINCTFGHGGPGDVSKNLFLSLSNNKNFECRFACSRYGEKNKSFYKIGNKLDQYLHYCFSILFDNEGFNSRIATLLLVRDIKRFNPDVINIHNLLGHYINYGILFKYLKTTNAKIVWTLHDCSAFTGHCINFERVKCNKWICGCYKCPLKLDYPKSALFDFSKRNYEKKKDLFLNVNNMELVTPSQWLKKLVGVSFLRKYQCTCIPNGVDLSSFKPTNSNYISENRFKNKNVVLFVAGVWNEMKGINIVNDLAKLVENKYKIVLIGKCDTTLNQSIHYLERTNNREDLAKWYSCSSVFVNPTLGDNFPTVNIESLACGTPVVTFDTGGSPEAVDDNTGVVVYKKDATHLLEGIKECLEKKEKGIITKDECLNRTKLYTIEKFSNKYIEVFNR